MALTSSYPVLLTADVAGTADFYRQHFGFETTFTSDWYVSLRSDRWELAVLDTSHETIPAAYRGPVASPAGPASSTFVLSIERRVTPPPRG